MKKEEWFPKLTKEGIVKKAIAVTLITSSTITAFAGLGFGISKILEKAEKPNEGTTCVEPEDKYINSDIIANGYYEIGEPSFNGSYYQYSEEELVKMARNSLKRVGKLLGEVEGITPMGVDGEFYPNFFNEYFLASVAYNESSGRTVDKNGKPITSDKGAMGLMQIKEEALDYTNDYISNFMGVKDVHYTLDDLKDGETSMDIATIYLIANCKNFARENDRIFNYLNENFSERRQEEVVLAYYNNGEGYMNGYMDAGTVKEYLREGAPDNYVNKIVSKRKELEKKNTSLEEYYNFEVK